MKSLNQIAEKIFLEEEQLQEIENFMIEKENYAPSTIRKEIEWFFVKLGMPEYYFQTTPLKMIAEHIEAVKAAKIMATSAGEKELKLDMVRELENEAIYLADDCHVRAREMERLIEEKYSNFRLQSYRTLGTAIGAQHIRMYLVYMPEFKDSDDLINEMDLNKIACPSFLDATTRQTYNRYQRLIKKAQGWETPLIDVSFKKETDEIRIMVVTNRDSNSRFFSNVSDVINTYNLVSNRKYIEQFANGKTVYSFYIDKIEDEELIRNFIDDIILVYVIPESPLAALFVKGELNAQEKVFGVTAWSFAHQFLSSYNEEYIRLSERLKDSPELLGLLRNMKTRLANDTYDEAKVWDALIANAGTLKKVFQIFKKKFDPDVKDHDIRNDLEEMERGIQYQIIMETDREIFKAILQFIRVTQRTNFYKKEKTSLSFLYDPSFLNPVDYPEKPYGIIHVVGREMRGFHIRFRDVARGGIRIVRSNNYQNYLNNSDFIFDENYDLAFTQQKKNKDIPEGGSKGTILLRWEYKDKAETAFKKYINGLLDLMMPDQSMVDYYKKDLLLFLGPDEGTADLMDWASSRAKVMEYPYWKAFSTGRSVTKGGIPHDLYGMGKECYQSDDRRTGWRSWQQ